MSFVYNKGLHVCRHSRNILLIKFYARILIPDLYNSLNQNNVFHTNNFQYIVLRIIPKRLNRIHVWAIPWSINNLQILRSNKVFNCLRTLATYTVFHEYASIVEVHFSYLRQRRLCRIDAVHISLNNMKIPFSICQDDTLYLKSCWMIDSVLEAFGHYCRYLWDLLIYLFNFLTEEMKFTLKKNQSKTV